MSLESETALYATTNFSWNSNMSILNISLNDPDSFNFEKRDPLFILIPVTIIYVIIFLTGVIGNVSTCIVISRNKSMHTATNYYLFSLAISDLLLLLSGLPPEIYHMWSPWVYIFGETFCFVQGLAAETSVNASVLTITAFTVERYVAICHPFLSHTMSKLSRAIKFVIGIWIVSLCLALPQAVQFGVKYEKYINGELVQSKCTITWTLMPHIFEISTFVIFVGPMTVITVLYCLIGVKLRRSRILTVKRPTQDSPNGEVRAASGRSSRNISAQNHVIKMLVAVVVAFFICWAPFHAQRLLAVYISAAMQQNQKPDVFLTRLYQTLNYISGVLYFMSTTVNPVLYNIMSNKFRDAFKSTLAQLCDRRHRGGRTTRRPTYSTLTRYQASLRNHNRSIQSEPLQRANSMKQTSPYANRTTTEFNRPIGNAPHKEELLIQLHSTSAPILVKNSHDQKKQFFSSRGFRSRNSSESSSQATVMTSMSKVVITESNNHDCEPKNGIKITKFGRPLSSVVVKKKSRKQLRKPRLSPVNFVTFAHRLGSMFKPVIHENGNCEGGLKVLSRHRSVDSGNTISNSSLQDLDDTEFSSSDLARYMGELNQSIT